MAIKISIDVTKVSKVRLYVGKKGKYLGAILVDKPDDYGNDGFVCEDVTKEERAAGTKGQIIGNWKYLGAKPQQQAPQQRPAGRTASPPPRPPSDPDLDPTEPEDLPF